MSTADLNALLKESERLLVEHRKYLQSEISQAMAVHIAALSAALRAARDTTSLLACIDRRNEMINKLEVELESLRAASADAGRLDFLASEYIKVEPINLPTGAGDYDVGWRLTNFHQQPPCERVVAELFRDDLRAAIDAAASPPRASAERAEGEGK